jgi:hypothetical protein
MAGCQRSQLDAPAGEESIGRDEQGIRPLASEGRERRVDLLAGAKGPNGLPAGSLRLMWMGKGGNLFDAYLLAAKEGNVPAGK